MSDIKIGYKLPEDLIGNISDGMSGFFGEKLTFILKMDDLEKEDIEVFNENKIIIDLLKLDMYKDIVGSIYSFSILVDSFIDNSEVMIDFRVENIKGILPEKFVLGEGIEVEFALVDEEDNVLGLREFKLSEELSNIIIEKAYEQNNIKVKEDKLMDYVILAFQKIFENEPEENLKLYSIGSYEVEK